MSPIKLDVLDKKGIEINNLDLTEKMASFNKMFKTSVEAENGFYGSKTIDRGNGLTIDIARNDLGQIAKDYYLNGKLIQKRLKLSDGVWERTRFDDNGSAYLKETIKFGKDRPKEFFYQLAADTKVVKGNFEAITDSLGRPILNEIKDVQLREGARQAIKTRRTVEYRLFDDRGHIIADSLGGPSTAENIVAQLRDVNRAKFKEIENTVRQLKRDNPNSKIDYSVKTNYAGKSARPSSFEARILIDGKEYQLSKELSKIYNEADLSKLSAAKTNALEKIEQARPMREMGKEMGKSAAMITFAVSTVDNVGKYVSGDISAEEMTVNIVKETAEAGAIGYGTGFISKAISVEMQNSGQELIKQLGGSSIPAAVVSFGVTSFDSVNEFAKGTIDLKEFTYKLSENGAGVAGSIEGGKLGAAVAGPAGAVVGGMVGYAITTEAYATIIQAGGKGASFVADKAQDLATSTYEAAKEVIPEKAAEVKDAMLKYASMAKLPISL